MTFQQHNYAKEWIILLVDDEEDNLQMAKLTLEYWGAKVHEAKNGIQGLQVLDQLENPTVILLDLSMPEMDGWTMFKKVREQSRFYTVPIIALTAHAMTNDKAKVMAAGFDGYITKPFMIDSFMERIKNSIEQRSKKLAADIQETVEIGLAVPFEGTTQEPPVKSLQETTPGDADVAQRETEKEEKS